MTPYEAMRRLRKFRPSAAVGLMLLFSAPAYSYSVLTHEAIIDSTWDSAIKPLLLKRFPAATADELTQAHGFAYGGCIIQDLGYYPFGSKFFSNLTHYVRTGDFILNLIRDSQDLNEYAFALGALSHYAADNNGHPIAVNRAVPLFYPKLRVKFGTQVTYADDPVTHAKTEFAFDVFQAAKGRYASAAYKSFIGFEVSKSLLDRAFQDTYGMPLEKVFLDVDLAIGSYRRAVGTILPAMTRVAWQIKKQEIRKDVPSATRKTFLYNLSRSSYEKNWGATYKRPGIRSKILAALFRFVPKVGPWRPLGFEKMTPEIEKMYMASFNSTIDRYRQLLSEQNSGHLKLSNDNLDVGTSTPAGKYSLTDATYSQLLHKMQGHYTEMPEVLRSDIIAFYRDLGAPISTKANHEDWANVLVELDRLQAVDADLRHPIVGPAGVPLSK
ncbi:MAG: zinc dependent phospholipase C family protein [Candidatus Sulfopaludibacter sp.]|nr:zinc dependent phospholipase C family protein [Candidatus Sulfopaludibacter sp.]